MQIAYIKFVGTHAEYDKVDAATDSGSVMSVKERTMEITPIRTEIDYRAALRVVSELVDQDPSPDTPEGERLDVLFTLIEAYERKHHPIDLPDPHRH